MVKAAPLSHDVFTFLPNRLGPQHLVSRIQASHGRGRVASASDCLPMGLWSGKGQPPVGVLTADSLRLYYGRTPPPNL